MSNRVVSFSSSIEYLLHANNQFDYIYYYNNLCGGMSREQVERKFKDDLENGLFEPAASDSEVTRWINEQLEYNLPLMSSTEVDEFWILYEDKKNYYNMLKRQSDYQKNLHELYQRNIVSSSSSQASSSRSVYGISSISD